jgi:hypothetical protein
MRPAYLLVAIIANALSAFSLSAKSPFIFATGNSFFEHCDGSTKPDCLAYVIGVAEGLQAAPEFGKTTKLICPPERVTVGQMHDVVLASLRSRPQERHVLLGPLAAVALANAFPCRKAKK